MQMSRILTNNIPSNLVKAGRFFMQSPLRESCLPLLRGCALQQAADLFDVPRFMLENYLVSSPVEPAPVLEPDDSFGWLSYPAYPAGCSVGGAIAGIFGSLEEMRRDKPRIVEHNRHMIQTVLEITSEGSAAGYDSHGVSLVVLDLKTGDLELVQAKTSGDIDERGYMTINQLIKQRPEIETGEVMILVNGAQTRAATQGDNMYSRANAHLHYELMTREMFTDVMTEEERIRFREEYPLLINEMGPFNVGHNGDVNSKIKWERYFFDKGFTTEADCDSKEIPRLERSIYECLQADRVLGTEQRFLAWFVKDLKRYRVLSDEVVVEEQGIERRLVFKEQMEDVLEIARNLKTSGASLVTVAGAVAARLLSFCDPTSVYVFETLTNIREHTGSYLPVTTIVKGPKAGGMIIYRDESDEMIPLKYASDLSNLRNRIKQYKDERREEIDVDYITSGAKVKIRDGKVDYVELGEWQIAEIQTGDGGTVPVLAVFDILSGTKIQEGINESPIIDYRLEGPRKTAVLKAAGHLVELSRVDRTVVYDTVLGNIISGPTSVLGKQVKSFPTEEDVVYAVDNQYGAEILLAYVTLLRNTRNLFDFRMDHYGRLKGDVRLKLASLFNLDGKQLDEKKLRRILRKVTMIYGLGEGTSRNTLGIAFSTANLEGLNDVVTQVMESNLARTEKPHMDENTLLLFVSNSGGTKPVVALSGEIMDELGDRLDRGPYIWSVTNLITSELARISSRSLGAAVTNLPWEKAVGSTFAAFTALQTILTFIVYLHEVRGAIKPRRAQYLYQCLAKFPEVARSTLSSSLANERVEELGEYIAGNNLDLSFIGALQGFDATEGALKFAEMVQHPRVKFYSGAYDQHGQRATYLRDLRTNPGSLLFIHIPNLETSIGSWMAQLIKENQPRAGRIACIACEEDMRILEENGADFVIPSPTGTSDNMFADALSKMLLDNMITEATIEKTNRLATRISSWGHRLLDLAAERDSQEIFRIQKELTVYFRNFKRYSEGDYHSEMRRQKTMDLERQLSEGRISVEDREDSLGTIYKTSRRVSMVPASTRDRINDLFKVLLECDSSGSEDRKLFYSLLDDLILEFSDRSLAMRLSDERYFDNPPKARVAVHYQGVAKLIGCNPIKPDNIAKFQQGWGIQSFVLPPGRRLSDAVYNLPGVLERLVDVTRGRCSREIIVEESRALTKIGFSRRQVAKIQSFLDIVDVRDIFRVQPCFTREGTWRFCRIQPGDCCSVEDVNPDKERVVSREFVQIITGLSEPVVHISGRIYKLGLELAIVDKYGDLDQIMVIQGRPRILSRKQASHLARTSPYLNSKIAFVLEWLSDMPRKRIVSYMRRIHPAHYLLLERRDLVHRIELLERKRKQLEKIKFKEEISQIVPDLFQIGLDDLYTMKNVFKAVNSIRGMAIYQVEIRSVQNEIEWLAQRDLSRTTGLAATMKSSYDNPDFLRGTKRIAAYGGRLKMGYGKDDAPTIIIPVWNDENVIIELLLLHPEIRDDMPVAEKIGTLGDKYHRIIDHVTEYVVWDDKYLQDITMVDLMMLSDEEIANDRIIPAIRKRSGRRHKSID